MCIATWHDCTWHGQGNVPPPPPPPNWVVHVGGALFGLCETDVERVLVWIPIIISKLNFNALLWNVWMPRIKENFNFKV
jgi:hypothetical protein